MPDETQTPPVNYSLQVVPVLYLKGRWIAEKAPQFIDDQMGRFLKILKSW
jgi:hypothetical protein